MAVLSDACALAESDWIDGRSLRCFHQIFEGQAAIAPSKTAIRCGGESVTYAALNCAANTVAAQLSALGVGPGVLVGLYTERSHEMVIGLLGILKAGGAYLPLDSQYPQQRLEFMLTETAAPVVLCEASLCDRLPSLPKNSKVVSIRFCQSDCQSDAVANAVSGESASGDLRLEVDGTPATTLKPNNLSEFEASHLDQLAYIIYTSGSTGNPKGVMISQRNLADYCWAIAQPTALTAQDTYLHLASISFATSARQLMTPLAHGATVVVTTDEQRKSPLKALQLAKEERVTIMEMVPSYWRVLNAMLKQLDAPIRQNLLSNDLRFVNAHGEPLPRYLPDTWQKTFQHPAATLNLYGQAEATGVVTHHLYTSDESGVVVPVGSGIPRAQIYVLDADLQIAAPGTCGEIYVSGSGIAKGYFKRPEQTAEKFLCGPQIPSALRAVLTTDAAQTAVYKTGDLGRMRPDGVFEMLGRVDRQIKVNGIRLELSEVEAIIIQHPFVREVAVLAQKSAADSVYLATYLSLETEQVAAAEPELKTHPQIINRLKLDLERQMASHMIPSQFSVLDQLPMTPNGKADLKALPSIGTAPIRTTEFVAPSRGIERELAGIWSEALQLSSIGIYDDFFELGGNSLLAAQVAAQIESMFTCPVSLASFFQTPTIAVQANLLDETVAAKGSTSASQAALSCLIPMMSDEADGSDVNAHRPALFCVHGGGGSALMYRALARRMNDQVRLYGLQSSYLNNPEKLLHTIEEMADVYLQELRSVQPEGPYLIAGYCGGAPVALEIAQRLRADGQTVALLALFDPTAIQTYCTPPITRYESGPRGRLQSLARRLKRRSPRAILKRYWLKVKIKRYEQRQQMLPFDLRVQKVAIVNVRAIHRYVAPLPYSGPIAVFMPEESITPGGALAVGWKAISTGDFEVYQVAGNHHYDGATVGSLFHEPAVQTLAARLKESIKKVSHK
ncbi:MAG: amino acid adenylation domain-containing protein [Phormidesmis sp.]